MIAPIAKDEKVTVMVGDKDGRGSQDRDSTRENRIEDTSATESLADLIGEVEGAGGVGAVDLCKRVVKLQGEAEQDLRGICTREDSIQKALRPRLHTLVEKQGWDVVSTAMALRIVDAGIEVEGLARQEQERLIEKLRREIEQEQQQERMVTAKQTSGQQRTKGGSRATVKKVVAKTRQEVAAATLRAALDEAEQEKAMAGKHAVAIWRTRGARRLHVLSTSDWLGFLSRTALQVYLCMNGYAEHKPVTWVRPSTIAKRCGLSRRGTFKAMRELENCGFISRSRIKDVPEDQRREFGIDRTTGPLYVLAPARYWHWMGNVGPVPTHLQAIVFGQRTQPKKGKPKK